MKEIDVALAEAAFIQRFDRCQRTYLLQPRDLSPYLAYHALKQLFGPPNTPVDDPDKTQWEYHLCVSDTLMDIYDWKMGSWSIAVYRPDGSEKRARDLACKVKAMIEKAAQRYKARQKEALRSPNGYVVQNPFSVYYGAAEAVLKHTTRNPQTNRPLHEGGLAEVMESFWLGKDLCKGAFLLYIAAFEGFVNLIYELYLPPDLRDERIYEKLSREQIDLKVRLAPVYCRCFSGKPIDPHKEAFKTFQRIANLRNDFVHGNFTKLMKAPFVQEDGYTFFLEYSEVGRDTLPTDFSSIDIDSVLQVKSAVDDMVRLMVSAMKPRYRKQFAKFVGEEYIYVETKGSVMVPMDY